VPSGNGRAGLIHRVWTTYLSWKSKGKGWCEMDEPQELKTLTKLVETIKQSQEANQKMLTNHSQAITRPHIRGVGETGKIYTTGCLVMIFCFCAELACLYTARCTRRWAIFHNLQKEGSVSPRPLNDELEVKTQLGGVAPRCKEVRSTKRRKEVVERNLVSDIDGR
jgi:hypothetical protein